MNIYAQSYFQTVNEHFADQVTLVKVTPNAWEPIGPAIVSEIALRYSRLIGYPFLASKNKSLVNHIVEPGYAHLIRKIGGERTVVMVHDIIPILRWLGAIPGLPLVRRPRLAEYSFNYLRRARSLVTGSEATKQDLVEFLDCSPERIVVSPHGLDPAFQCFIGQERVAARQRLGLPPPPTQLVLISGHQFYKNHETSLKVFRSLLDRGTDVRLVHLGKRDTLFQSQLTKNGLSGVISLSNLPLLEVVALFNAVDVLLFPSLYEGFGWPALQAMACGTPVVASNAGAIPEVVGDCGLLRDPLDVDGFTDDVERMLNDQAFSFDMVSRGRTRSRRFTWFNHASKVVNLYRQIHPDAESSPVQ